MIISATQIRKGDILNYKNELWRVATMVHSTPGNLRAIIRVVMKSLASGTKIEERFRSSETIEKAELDVMTLQYLYQQGDRYVFMNTENYDQIEIDEETMGDTALYIVHEATINALLYGEQIVGIDLPPKVELKVVETSPYMKSASVANAPKPAKMETGLTVNIPNFIEEGAVVRIDTTTGEYVDRVK